MKGSIYTLIYAAVLGTVCSLVLTFAASFTAPYKQANAEAEEVKNILLALNISIPDTASSDVLLEIYKENVQEQMLGDITTYVYTPPTKNDGSIAVSFAGPGLWGPIKGFLALDTDIETIRGITFSEQEETPGLGGEIASSWFQEQFVGKSIVDEDGNPGIIISSAGESAPNKVDAITGATMTCDKVQVMLNETIRNIFEEK